VTTVERLFLVLKFCSALGCGLIGGVFFAFSTFVMNALGRLQPPQGIAAMQAVNNTAISPLFMTALFGTGALCLAVAGRALFSWRQAGSAYLLTGGLLYLVGVVLVTIICNVPLNDALAKVEPHSVEGAQLWTRYLADWTKWNHVRTIAALIAAAIITIELRS
jgi:uncharacterized membrane protein